MPAPLPSEGSGLAMTPFQRPYASDDDDNDAALPEARVEEAESSSDAAPRPFGNYVLVRKLGTAGVAQVHLGLRLSPVGIERLVMIKWLHEGLSRHGQLVQSFLREAQVVGELTHASIVRVLDVGKHGGAYFMAMEYVDQEPLSDVLKELRKQGASGISAEEAVHIALQLCAALNYAHTKTSLD